MQPQWTNCGHKCASTNLESSLSLRRTDLYNGSTRTVYIRINLQKFSVCVFQSLFSFTILVLYKYGPLLGLWTKVARDKDRYGSLIKILVRIFYKIKFYNHLTIYTLYILYSTVLR